MAGLGYVDSHEPHYCSWKHWPLGLGLRGMDKGCWRQGYKERRTPDNIIRKITIEQTSVGLAHAHPKYSQEREIP